MQGNLPLHGGEEAERILGAERLTSIMLDAVRAYDVWIQAHPADSGGRSVGGRSVFRGLVETCAHLLPNLVLRKTNITADSNNLSLREATTNMQRYARAVLLLTAMPKSNTKVAGTAPADTFGILRLGLSRPR